MAHQAPKILDVGMDGNNTIRLIVIVIMMVSSLDVAALLARHLY